MKLAWVFAVAVLLAGCGSRHDGTSTGDSHRPHAASKALPSFDAATKTDAQKTLDGALQRVVSGGPISFRTGIEMSGTTVGLHGGVDFPHEASDFTLDVGGKTPGKDSGSIEFRILGTHVYQQPKSGPLAKCWFDYGASNPAFGGEAPWLHGSVAAVTDASALGFATGSSAVIVVEVPAVELLAISFGKLVNGFADQLTGQPVMTKAVVELQDGRYADLQFSVRRAFEALQASGVDLLAAFNKSASEPISESELKTLLKGYFAINQKVTFTYGDRVDRDVPPADELMDASHALESDAAEPELCEAAR